MLLLDDPLRNVDAKLRYEMRLELPRLLRTFGSTVLYVTQDYKEAMALGDRIAVLIDGAIAQLADPGAIYEAPASLDVARLFGDPAMNLVPSTVTEGPSGARAEVAGTRCRSIGALPRRLARGSPWVCVRRKSRSRNGGGPARCRRNSPPSRR